MNKTTKLNPWTVVGRIVFTAMMVFSVWFIFSNSMQMGTASSLQSEQVRTIVNKLAGMVGLGPFSSYTIRKLAHFAEFAALGFWLMLCLRVYTKRFVAHISWPLFICLFTAVMDETLQLYVQGRSASIKDVWVDFAGSCFGLFAALCVLLFCRMCYIVFHHRNED